MAEIFQYREQNYQHVGIYIAEYRRQFSSIAGTLEHPSQVCSVAACGWAYRDIRSCIVKPHPD